jgi:hypothetical protein
MPTAYFSKTIEFCQKNRVITVQISKITDKMAENSIQRQTASRKQKVLGAFLLFAVYRLLLTANIVSLQHGIGLSGIRNKFRR